MIKLPIQVRSQKTRDHTVKKVKGKEPPEGDWNDSGGEVVQQERDERITTDT